MGDNVFVPNRTFSGKIVSEKHVECQKLGARFRAHIIGRCGVVDNCTPMIGESCDQEYPEAKAGRSNMMPITEVLNVSECLEAMPS